MTAVKYIVTAIYIIVCIALIVITTMQTKDANGASETIMGSSTNNFYEKNKGRTKEGKIKNATKVLGGVFMLMSIALSALYVM